MIKFSLQWHITQKCQNRCKHCYMDEQAHDLTYEEYLECINNIADFEKKNDFNVSMVALTGGDPLLNKDWYKIACDLKKRNKKIMLLGNPENLTIENLEKMAVTDSATRIVKELYQLVTIGGENNETRN